MADTGKPTEVEVLEPPVHPMTGKTPVNAHPPELVEQAIELLLYKPASEVAKELGVSRRTVFEWRAKHAGHIDVVRDAILADRFDDRIVAILDELNDAKLKDTTSHTLGILLGIMADKRIQLGGGKKQRDNVRARIMWRNTDGSEMGVEIN